MSSELDARLLRLKEELDAHARIADDLGLDFGRPVRSLGDGYPENAIAHVGKITERLLKRLWRHHEVPGSPAGKMLKDLIAGCRPHIRSHAVIESLHDIQRLRNRAAHDGLQVADEDGLTAVRRLLDVLTWFTSTGSGALSPDPPRLTPAVAAKAEWLAGLYVTLDYKLVKRAELSRHTVYQLFARERGLRSEYAELLLSSDAGDVADVLEATGGDLLQTSLPKLTRFLILDEDEEDGGQIPEALRGDCRVVTYDRFLGTFVDLGRHLADIAAIYPGFPADMVPVPGDVLTADERSGEMVITRAGSAAELLDEMAAGGGNLLVVGRPGTGKTTLLKHLVGAVQVAGARRHRFYLDLSLKRRDEPFAEFVTRTLGPYLTTEPGYAFPLFCYFARSGSVLLALDGFDEAVPEMTQSGFLALFTDAAQVLSAESAVVMTSRVSFLEDSPQVRRLIDGTSLMPATLVHQLHAEGVDPLRVPRFSVLRLRDMVPGGSFLEAELAASLEPGEGSPPGPPGGDAATIKAGQNALAGLLWRHITQVTEPATLPHLISFFGLAFLRGVTVFRLTELVNELGIAAFDGGKVDAGSFRLRPLFRPAGPAAHALAFRHAAYQELLAAEFLRAPEGRDAALAAAARPRVTEQVREFLYQLSGATGNTDDCVVPVGAYLVGPGHHLMLRRITRPVRFDRFPVTVAGYKRFLDAVARDGPARWEHPATPAGISHEPLREHLPVPRYYDDPAYAGHPAVAVTWWSACAYASFAGGRLPTSLEWEAAARGFDGRLFPWGDHLAAGSVTCADRDGHMLATYDEWRADFGGRLKDALPGPVDAHPGNVSPSGVREMAGNVWELTATVLDGRDEAVICGGAADSPYRAVQASARDTCQRGSASGAVGFRCVSDIV